MVCKLPFCQPLSPVAGSLFLSFLVGAIPIVVVLVLLGILRRPVWQAALAGLVVGFVIAVAIWHMPIELAASSTLNGIAFALFPVVARTFKHSIIMAALLGLLVMAQQYLIPWMIPH